jgi:inward rectifier potassium channel
MATRTPFINVQTQEERDRDLGFGSLVSQQRHVRLLNRDGSFNIRRRQSWLDSVTSYHALMTMPWTAFIGLLAGAYAFLNATFALIYVSLGPDALLTATPPELSPRFLKAFFFSIDTFSTIGYGNIVPVGRTANAVVSAEAFCGLLGLALATGLLFARFSRPTAKVVFSNNAIVAPYNGISALQFRIINAKNNEIIELSARVLFSKFENDGGNRIRKYHPLQLERERVVFFPLTWTIVHPIDENSPMFGLSKEDLIANDAEFLILLTGIDETFSQTVHARSSYSAEEVIWGGKFVNIYKYDEHGHIVGVDMDRFHSFEHAQLPQLTSISGA